MNIIENLCKVKVVIEGENREAKFAVDLDKAPWFNDWIGKCIGDIVVNKSGKNCVVKEIEKMEIIILPPPPPSPPLDIIEEAERLFEGEGLKRNISDRYALGFNVLENGKIYGTKALDIYTRCCSTLGFNASKIEYFDLRQTLYSPDATKEGFAVWMIPHSSYTGDSNGIWANVIRGDKIYEVYKPKYAKEMNNEKRVTFIKQKNGEYVFSGIYYMEKCQRGLDYHIMIYKRISEVYPMV